MNIVKNDNYFKIDNTVLPLNSCIVSQDGDIITLYTVANSFRMNIDLTNTTLDGIAATDINEIMDYLIANCFTNGAI